MSSPLLFKKLGFEQRGLSGVEHRVDAHQYSCATKARICNLAPQRSSARHGLHPASGKATPHLVQRRGRDFVPHQPVEDTSCLLSIDEVGVNVSGFRGKRP